MDAKRMLLKDAIETAIRTERQLIRCRLALVVSALANAALIAYVVVR
uniref:Uncharacterized protein n=1 Tax=Myoviridae sp. cthAo37 TaxID=2827701 RepID=A0A8S5S501_9CAUD|nr:MAG TPA: hypothetical protein [Myoviridae sp. cthAo37]